MKILFNSSSRALMDMTSESNAKARASRYEAIIPGMSSKDREEISQLVASNMIQPYPVNVIKQIVNQAGPREKGSIRVVKDGQKKIIGMGVIIDAKKNFIALNGDLSKTCLFYMGFVMKSHQKSDCFLNILKPQLLLAKARGYETLIFDTHNQEFLSLLMKLPPKELDNYAFHQPGTSCYEQFKSITSGNQWIVSVNLKDLDITKLKSA